MSGDVSRTPATHITWGTRIPLRRRVAAHDPRRRSARGACPSDRAAARPWQLRLLGERNNAGVNRPREDQRNRREQQLHHRSRSSVRVLPSTRSSSTGARGRTGSGAPIWTAPASIRTSSPHGVISRSGLAVTANSGIFWLQVNRHRPGDAVVDGNIDVSAPFGTFFADRRLTVWSCGRPSFIYWLNTSGDLRVGRAPLSGVGPDPNFSHSCRTPVAAWLSTPASCTGTRRQLDRTRAFGRRILRRCIHSRRLRRCCRVGWQ